MVEPLKEKISALVDTAKEAARVTSEQKKINARDQLVAWLASLAATVAFIVTSLFSLIAQILDSIADYLLPYLQQVPRHDRPAWLAIATFIVMGLVILNKRRISGPSYVPPPASFMPVANPTLPSSPAPQGQPLPPGTPIDHTKSAF